MMDLVANGLWTSTITHPAVCHKNLFSIATFHRVLPERERQQYPYPGIAVTPEDLNYFLEYFTRHYTCGSLREIHTRWLHERSLAKPFLALTFDDGQRDNYDYASPILARHGVSASFFIPVEAIERQTLLWHDQLGFALQTEGAEIRLGKLCAEHGIVSPSLPTAESWVERLKAVPATKRLAVLDNLTRHLQAPSWAAPMTWEHIQDLARKGHEIGSHSMSHRMMTECRGNELAFEVQRSREILESKLKVPVLSFCYPNGNVDLPAEHAVRNAGYVRAVTTQWGSNFHGQNSFCLKRFDMDANRIYSAKGQRSTRLLAWRTSGLYPMGSSS